MANTNGAFGLRPIGVVGQATNTTGMTEYRIASGNSNAIYQGSPVISGDVNTFRQPLVKRFTLTTGLGQARILIIPSWPSCMTTQCKHT